MNILPKKSWHVRTRKNIERVQRDEAEAERLSKVERDRRLRAEHEARLKELRVRAGIHKDEPDKRIDLFQDPQDVQGSSDPDIGVEANQKDPRGKIKASPLNSLIKPEDVNKPWYCAGSRPKPEVKTARSDLITRMYDPMTAIQHAERIVRQRRAEKSRLEASTSQARRPSPDSSPEIICEIPRQKHPRRVHENLMTEDRRGRNDHEQRKRRRF